MQQGAKIGSLHTTGTASQMLACSESTVRYWVRCGRLTPIATTPNGVRLFAPADIERIRCEREAARPL
jgi:DNA-binding transcriptional MerR regulator